MLSRAYIYYLDAITILPNFDLGYLDFPMDISGNNFFKNYQYIFKY
jgi:hypothetical protein